MKPRINHLIACVVAGTSITRAADINAVTNNGDWMAAGTWFNGAVPSAANHYFVPTGIAIDGYTGGSTNSATVRTFGGASLTIQNGGALYLDSNHGTSYPDWTYTINNLKLENGSSLHVRGGAGTDFFLTNGFSVANGATVAIRHSAGSYDQRLRLGAISGAAGTTIQLLATHDASNCTYKDNYANVANSSFAGDWFLDYTAGGTESIRLRADAANALGTGTVTLDDRARLEANAAGALNSLSGIALNKSTSNLTLNNHDWSSPTGTLTVTNGSVNAGSATISIASFSQAAGTINLTVGGSSDGKIITSGNATFTGGSIAVALAGSPVGKTFDLITYGGSLSGAPAFTLSGDSGRLTPVFNNGTGNNDKVTLGFSGSVAELVWKGDADANWNNNSTQNFNNGGSDDVFRSYDNVTFDGSATSFAPDLVGTLNAGTVTFTGSSDYTLGGAGSLAGDTMLVKSGTGSLTISNTTASTFSGGISISGGSVNITTPQNYTGNISISGGKLVLGNASALGATGSRTVSVTGGGQFDFNGFSPGTSRAHTYRISGDGGGTGALTNSSTTSVGANSGIQNLELLGNATIGGAGRFDIARVGSTSGTITGNGHTLTKTGTNQINLRGAASDLTIIVNEGILGLEDSDLAFGGASGNVTVNNTAVLGVYGARTIATPVTLNNGTTLRALGGGAANWTGLFTVNGAAILDLSSQAKTISGNIGGTGGITKIGGNTLTLSGNNSHAGGTTIELGQVNVTSGTAFGSGTLTFQHTTGSTTTTRVNLADVTIANDIILNTNAQTGFRGPINTSAGNTLSTLSGTITIQSGVGNGGHFSSADGGVLRLTGTLNTTGPVPNIRSGTVEMGTTGGNLTQLSQGEGTLRLVATNGIQPTLRLNLAVSGGGTLDLNGFNQTLAELRRHTTHAATVTNSAATPSVLTIDGTVNHDFTGTINDGTGGVSVTKAGPSTWNLTGNNTYSGTTLVSAGTLLVTGQLTASDVSVAGAATIGGSGALGGDLEFLTGSFLEIADINDPLAIAGTVTFGSGFGIDNILGIDWQAIDFGTYTLLDNATDFSLAGIDHFGIENAYDLGGGRSAYFQNGSLQVVLIPEPHAALLGGLGALVLLRRRRN